MRGYLDVAYRLGLLLAQFDRAPAKRCTLQYRGEVAGKDTQLITAAFAAGLLAQALEEEINIVNAEVLLRERGIELIEQSRGDMGAFSSMIPAEVTTETHTLPGGRHGVRPRHAAAGAVGRLSARRLSRRRPDGLHPSRRAGHHRHGRHDLRPAQDEHRPDGRRPRQHQGGDAIGVLEPRPVRRHRTRSTSSCARGHRAGNVIKLPPAGNRPAWMSGTENAGQAENALAGPLTAACSVRL